MDISDLKVNAKKNNLAFGKAFDKTKEELHFPMMVKLQEEVGELADAVLVKHGLVREEKLKIIDESKLGDEMADVIFTTVSLADIYDVDIEKAMKKKMQILQERWKY